MTGWRTCISLQLVFKHVWIVVPCCVSNTPRVVDPCLRTRISILLCVSNTFGLWFRVCVQASVYSPLTKHVWIVDLVVYKHRLHPVLQTRLECGSFCVHASVSSTVFQTRLDYGSVSGYKHLPLASLVKNVWILVPCCEQASVSTRVSNTVGLRFLVCVHASVPSLGVSNAFGSWIPVCTHASVSSLGQTRLIMVACLWA